MTDYFVWDGGDNSDGLAWDTAFTSLARDWGATITPATDTVYIRSIHSESDAGANFDIVGSTAEGSTAPVVILCVTGAATGTTIGTLVEHGASVTHTTTSNSLRFAENLYIYGVDFFSANLMSWDILATVSQDMYFEQCRFELTTSAAADDFVMGAGAFNGSVTVFKDCQFAVANVASSIDINNGEFHFIGGIWEDNVTQIISSVDNRSISKITFRGMDLSAIVTGGHVLIGQDGGSQIHVEMDGCILGTGADFVDGTMDVPGYYIHARHCAIGTDADPTIQEHYEDMRGRLTISTAEYMDGGSSDGVRTNPISWEIDTSVNSRRSYPGHPFVTPALVAWTDGDGSTAYNYDIFIASDATLNDDEVWVEMDLPNDASTNSLRVQSGTRVAPVTTAAAVPTDSVNTWTGGAAVATKQRLRVTHTPDKPGPVTARVYVAKASDTVFVNREIVITAV